MANAIVELANDPALQATLREGSKAYAQGPASWESTTVQRLALLNGKAGSRLGAVDRT
jgi:hypothetical protein